MIKDSDVLLSNIDKIHTTELGKKRIAKNIDINNEDPIKYLKNKIQNKNCIIYKKGKNYYCEVENIRITINSYNYCIITTHKINRNNNLKMTIKSLYICVDDMPRAVKFYTNFFEREPIKNDSIYSVFNIDGFRFGLFAYRKMKESHTFGSNCLPSIEVDNLNILKKKIKDLSICFPLTKIGNNYVVEFIDSEGNHIELTTPIKK